MRPIPDISTDLLFSPFARSELVEVGEALGVSDIKIITTATQKPDQVLFHAVLNGIQTYLKLNGIEEAPRASEISAIAETIYAKLFHVFKQRVAADQLRLDTHQDVIANFCQNLDRVESSKAWNLHRFDAIWNLNNYPARWQKKAIESYRLVKNRIETGQYIAPANGMDTGGITLYWSQRNHEYKHYRDIARTLVEDYISRNYAPEARLKLELADERIFRMFIGGMGSGKSEMTKFFLRSLPEEIRSNIVLHNADYLKFPLYRNAVAEGIIPADHVYKGYEVQSASSNALYEGTRKRGFMARQLYRAPSTTINSVVLGATELCEGIAGGGQVIAHHVNMELEHSIAEAAGREGRIIPREDITWSNSASAKSLLNLTDPQFINADIVVHLYSRSPSSAPEYYGSICARTRTMYIEDEQKFAALTQAAFPDIALALASEKFLSNFISAGFSLAKEPSQIVARGALYAVR